MIKKAFIYILIFNCTNTILYGSQLSELLLEKRVQEAMQIVHEKIIIKNLNHIVQAYEPLNYLCGYLNEIPGTHNFKVIRTAFEHLKNQVYDLNQNQPVNLRSALHVQAGYCKLLYACFELHNQDIKKRFFPFQKVIDKTIADLQTYINLHNNSFHQMFHGLIDYTLLQHSIVTFFKKIADPDIHIYIPLEIKNVTDSLQRLQKAIDAVVSEEQEENVTIDLAMNDICNAYNQLIEMKHYLASKDFFGALPLIHHSFKDHENNDLAVIVAKNDQFKTALGYTMERGDKLCKYYLVGPYNRIKNIVNHKRDYCTIITKTMLLDYVMKPLHNYQLPNEVMPKNTHWYDTKEIIKEGIKKELLNRIEVVRCYLASAIHTMEDEKNSLQINLDKNVFNPDALEKIVASFFLRLPIHDQNNVSLSWVTIIFLPQIIMQNKNAIKISAIKNALKNVIAQLDNKEFFSNFIENFKTNYRNEFSKKLAFFTSILPGPLSINVQEYTVKHEDIFIYNKKFYKTLYNHFSQTKANMLERLGDIAVKKIAIYEEIASLEKNNESLMNNESKSWLNKVAQALDDFLYVRESLIFDNKKRINVLYNRMQALKEKEFKYYTFFDEIERLQSAIKKIV